jgi:hypothetical protein
VGATIKIMGLHRAHSTHQKWITSSSSRCPAKSYL